MMPLTCGLTSDTAVGSVRPGSSAVSWTGCSLTTTKPAIGVICFCCGGLQADRMAAITTMTEKVRDMNSPQNTGTAGPDLGVLLPEAAPNPNLPRGQITPEGPPCR